MNKEKTTTERQINQSGKSLATIVDAALTIEKLRVATEVRQSHLARNGKR